MTLHLPENRVRPMTEDEIKTLQIVAGTVLGVSMDARLPQETRDDLHECAKTISSITRNLTE